MTALAWLACAGAACAADAAAPRTPVRPVTDVYHGTAVVDPYRWMENMGAAPFKSWLKAQSQYTERVLAQIPGRPALRQRLAVLADSGETVYDLQSAASQLFYLKAESGHEQPRLFVRAGVDRPDRLLLDPLRVPGERGAWAIDFFTASPDGRLIALGLSRGGSEDSTLRVLSVADGKLGSERITRTGLNESVAWLSDSQRFVYNRLPRAVKGKAERFSKSTLWLHRAGQSESRDKALFGWGVSRRRPFDAPDVPAALTTEGSPWVLAEVAHGDAAERSYFAARMGELAGAATPWRRIAGPQDGITTAVPMGQAVFGLSQKAASRRELVRWDLTAKTLPRRQVLPASDTVLRQLHAGKESLFIEGLDGGVSRLLQIEAGANTAQTVKLPIEGVLREVVGRGQGALLRMENFAQPAQWWGAVPGKPTRPLALQKPSTLDTSGLETQRVLVRSADGTQVPLSILHRKGLALDGARPTLLLGYGAYGIAMEPRFSAASLAWVERGGVMATAHVRGGGEFGADWHRGAHILNKQNTVSDFIACAQYLVDQRYTRPDKLAGTGRSAGGLTIGAAITQRPDLFGAAHSGVGIADLLRMELTPNGAPNVAEFGTVKRADQFRAMAALSPYHHVVDGTKYPAVMVTTGVNDPRVDTWEPAKFAARLQAATASGKPVLLRVDFEAGHGMGSGRSQRINETADVWSFLLWQMGEAGFAPQ